MKNVIIIALLLSVFAANAQPKNGFNIIPQVITVEGDTACSISWELLTVTRDAPREARATVFFYDKNGKELAERLIDIKIPIPRGNSFVSEVDDAVLTELKRFKKSL